MVVKKTQSSRIKEVAGELDLPVSVVKGVVDKYIESLQRAVMNGEDIEVRGLFQIKVREVDGVPTPRGTVSPVLKEKIKRGY